MPEEAGLTARRLSTTQDIGPTGVSIISLACSDRGRDRAGEDMAGEEPRDVAIVGESDDSLLSRIECDDRSLFVTMVLDVVDRNSEHCFGSILAGWPVSSSIAGKSPFARAMSRELLI